MIEISADIRIPKRLLEAPAAIERAMANGLNGLAKSIQVDFEVTAQTWDAPPLFTIQAPDEHTRLIGTDENSPEGRIYKFVSGGTRVRYATMMPGYVAKTRPGQIRSFAGHGGVAFISRKHPRPGIQARMFATTIARKWQRLAKGVLQRMIDAEI